MSVIVKKTSTMTVSRVLAIASSLAFAQAISASDPTGAVDSAGVPTLTIEAAIDTAKGCVIDQKISVSGSFIQSAEFVRVPRPNRGPFWRVTWAYGRQVKGGQVFVAVFADRSCEIRYGE
jgi:hypothetical protein